MGYLKSFGWLDTKEGKDAAFDVIIVGSGPAGCVLANRLSEDGKHRVLLVEAGGSNEKELLTKIPATWAKNMGSSIDWNYETTAQKYIDDRKMFWPRGKVLGGSSSINALMYHHGSPADYDQWEKEGAPGWGYKELAPYFKKSEKHTPHTKHADVELAHRGDSGPWQTGYQFSSPVMANWIKSVEALGVPYLPDFNTPTGTMGVATFMTFVDQKGHRSSGATAYLTPDVLARKNLVVLTHTRCTTVMLSKEGGIKAIGVELADETSHEKRKKVLCTEKGEVILAAGAINTPQILMLSGLGPKEELEKVGIECVKDLPSVGRHLQDHLMACLPFRMKPGLSFDWMATKQLYVLPYLIRWMLGWKGLLTNNGAEVAAFVRTDDPMWQLPANTSGIPYESNATPGGPDIEFISAPVTFVDHGRFMRSWFNGLTINTYIMQPKSRGYVTLKSKDPFDYPIMEPNYLSEPADLQALVRGVRIAMRIARTPPISDKLDLRDPPKGSDPNAIETEEQRVYGFGDWKESDVTDEDLVKWVKRNVETIYHPTCTARIGATAADSVVDTELRVHGVDRLRVCDASVFPRIVSGHTTAPTIAVAEKGADIIRLALGKRMA